MRLVIFLICSGIGYLLGQYVPDPAGRYVSILVSYHLFLAFLIVTAEQQPDFAFPPVLSIVVTHSACLALLIGLGMGQRSVPILGLVRIFIPGLAPFESDWLFSGRKRKVKDSQGAVAAETAGPAIAYSGSAQVSPVAAAAAGFGSNDNDDWVRYLAQPRRQFKKAGQSVGDEFRIWSADRTRKLAEAAQAADSTRD